MVPVFPGSRRKDSAIYIQLEGKVWLETFCQIMRGEPSARTLDPLVSEIGLVEDGLSDPNPEGLKRWLKEHPEVKQPSR